MSAAATTHPATLSFAANTPHGFGIICLLTATVCVALIVYLRKKKML